MKKLALAALLALAGTPALAADSLLINGAGATFPFPLYSKWFSEYNKLAPGHPDQLPVDRLRRRHPAVHRRHGRLRRDRRAR